MERLVQLPHQYSWGESIQKKRICRYQALSANYQCSPVRIINKVEENISCSKDCCKLLSSPSCYNF